MAKEFKGKLVVVQVDANKMSNDGVLNFFGINKENLPEIVIFSVIRMAEITILTVGLKQTTAYVVPPVRGRPLASICWARRGSMPRR